MASPTLPFTHNSTQAPTPAKPTLVGYEAGQVGMGNLMSPPDPIYETFNHDSRRSNIMSPSISRDKPASEAAQSAHQYHPLPMSPPVSPFSKSTLHHRELSATPATILVNDPVLYPADDGATPTSFQEPLFAPHETEDRQKIVDNHVRARSVSALGIAEHFEPPLEADYHLILSFKSQVMRHYEANPRSWLRKERAFLEADRRIGSNRLQTVLPSTKFRPVMSTHKPSRAKAIDRVTKPQALAAAPRAIRANGNGPVTSTAGGGGNKRSSSRASPTPDPSRRVVAPNREDKDYDALPDYCPPLDSLPARSNSLKVEWKGQPIDLSADPQVHLLHPDEVSLAGNLRLDCATYLTSKRRIFERRLQCLRTGKEFRKTDAQQACKIDVNKASKLWTAFDKVGWLNDHWVRKFL